MSRHLCHMLGLGQLHVAGKFVQQMCQARKLIRKFSRSLHYKGQFRKCVLLSVGHLLPPLRSAVDPFGWTVLSVGIAAYSTSQSDCRCHTASCFFSLSAAFENSGSPKFRHTVARPYGLRPRHGGLHSPLRTSRCWLPEDEILSPVH